MADVEVVYEELQAGATAQKELGDEASGMSCEAGGIRLPDGALGKLPESDEIRATADQRADGAREALETIAEVMGMLADGLTMTAEDFKNADDFSVHTYDKMRSGS